MRQVTVGEFLSPEDCRKAAALNDVRKIHDEIVKPQLAEINAKLGQENDAMYLAYMIVFALEQAAQKVGR